MTSTVEAQAQANAELLAGASGLRKGTCTAIDWVNGVATVQIPGSADLKLPMSGVPIINERCWIGFLGNSPVVLGPVPRPPFGTVTAAPSAGLVRVLCDDNISRLVTYSGGTLTVGTRVLIDWPSGGEIVGTPQADPNTGTPIGQPGTIATGGVQTRVFNPVASGTWRDGAYASGWVGGELQDSDHNRGAYFYSGIADSIPDNATEVKLQMYLHTIGGYGGNPSIGYHTLASMAGSLVVSGAISIPVQAGVGQWLDISGWADLFKTGAALGIGTHGGGNWRFAAAGQNNSGAISASWRA